MKKCNVRKTRGRLTTTKIINLYTSGKAGTRVLSRLNGTTRGSICAMLRRRKITRGRYGGPARLFKKGERIKGKLTHEEVVRLYTHDELSPVQIAKLDGTTVAVVRRILKKARVTMREPVYAVKHGCHTLAKKHGVPVETLLRLFSILHLGGKCVKCSNSDIRVLQLNHVDGKTRIPEYGDFLKIISNTPTKDTFDVRCANCNIIYEFERGRRKPYPEVAQDKASLNLEEAPTLL